MRQVGEPTISEMYQFYLDLFKDNDINSIFNGWGNEPVKNCMIYFDDPEAEIIKKAIAEGQD